MDTHRRPQVEPDPWETAAGAPPAPGDRVSPGSRPCGLGSLRMVGRAAWIILTALRVLLPAAAALPWLRVRGDSSRAKRMLYRRCSDLLMLLGPAFVKAGQVLGTRRDVLPVGLCDELSALMDSVAPLDRARSRHLLESIYGGDLAATFSEISFDAVASGSIACVYRARLTTGEDVALKVLRPDAERLLRSDLSLMSRGADVLARLPRLRNVPVRSVVAAMCGAVLAQVDFGLEAQNLLRLRHDLSRVSRVRVPRVHLRASRPECIVMEFMTGLDARAEISSPPVLRRKFAASAIEAMYQMLFVEGFVHCDMHPGNLYFTAAGNVVVLDAGFAVQLSPRLRRLFAEFFLNMAIGRGDRCADIVLSSAERVLPDAHVERFRTDMAALVVRSHQLTAREFSLMEFATSMFDLQKVNGVQAAPELIFPLLSLLVIEGIIRELDPELDFQAAARPVLNRGLFGA